MDKDSAASNDMLDAALSYAKRGWHVFPLHGVTDDGACTCSLGANCSDAGKHPAVSGGVKAASTDKEKIFEWFRESTGARRNIAIATGEISGLTVLDIDITNGKKGAETWGELTREKGEPNTRMSHTGSGGLHVLFNYNSALNTCADALGPGIDCRNDGGYIVAPPSRHRSGKLYEWNEDTTRVLNLPKHLTRKPGEHGTRGRPRKDDPTNRKYPLEEVARMLEHVSADLYDDWRNIGVILGREFNRSDEAWEVYVSWASTWGGSKGRGHDEKMREAFYEVSQRTSESQLSIGTLIKAAIAGGWAPKTGQVPVEHLLYYAPSNDFIFKPTGAHWPTASVNAACSKVNEDGQTVQATDWLKKHRLITSMTSDPALEEVTLNKNAVKGNIVDSEGSAIFNKYIRPVVRLGNPDLAKPWLDHVRLLMPCPGDAEQFLNYMAFKAQNPGAKIRFALLLAGQQGIGKDTALSMCYSTLGPWNVSNITPMDLEKDFNEYEASALVVIGEVANTADLTKFAFNERTKELIAGNPDAVLINPKYAPKFHVRRHHGVIVTTNHATTGLYLPTDDRRYDVIACNDRRGMGIADDAVRARYFEERWDWYYTDDEQGARHVAAYLMARDVSGFNPNTGQRITEAHKEIVAAGFSGDECIIDALESLGQPDVVRSDAIISLALANHPDMRQADVMRKMPHALNRAGYQKLICRTNNDGRWSMTVNGKRTRVLVYYKPDKIGIAEAAKAWLKLEPIF